MKTPLFSQTAAPNAASTRYHPVAWGDIGVGTWSTVSTIYRTPVPIAGTLKGFIFRCPATISAGTWAMSVQKNGVDVMTATCSTGVQIATDATEVAFGAGDDIQLKLVPTSTPTAQANGVQVVLIYETAPNRSLVLSNVPASAVTTAFFMPINGTGTITMTEATATAVMPCAGTFETIYGILSAAPGTTSTVTATLYVNGAPSSLATTLGSADTTKNEASSVSVSAGDLITIQRSTNGTAPASATLSLGLEFRPAVDGESPQFTYPGAPNTGATRYQYPSGNAATSAESTAQMMVTTGYKVRSLYLNLVTAPAAGKNWAITGRKGGVSQTVTATVADAATTGNDTTHDFDVVDQDLIDWMIVPTGTPTGATNMRLGWVAYIQPASARMLTLLGVG